ncbi:hypothetical protein ACMFMG_007693 [Clarireedia jacksonii]
MQVLQYSNALNRRASNLSGSCDRQTDGGEQVGKIDSQLLGDHTVKDVRPGWDVDVQLNSNPQYTSRFSAPLALRNRMAIENMCGGEAGATIESNPTSNRIEGTATETFMMSSPEFKGKNLPTIENTREPGQNYHIEAKIFEVQNRKRKSLEMHTMAVQSPPSEIPMNSSNYQLGLASVEPRNRKDHRANQVDHDSPIPPSLSPVGSHRLQNYQNALRQNEQSRRAIALPRNTEIRTVTAASSSQPYGLQISSSQQLNSFEQERAKNFRLNHLGEQSKLIELTPQMPLEGYQAWLDRVEQENKAQLQEVRRESERYKPNFQQTNEPIERDYAYEMRRLEQQNKRRRKMREDTMKRQQSDPAPSLTLEVFITKAREDAHLSIDDFKNNSALEDYYTQLAIMNFENYKRREQAQEERRSKESKKEDASALPPLASQASGLLTSPDQMTHCVKCNRSFSSGYETFGNRPEDLEAIEAQIKLLQKKADRIRILMYLHG